MKPFLSVLALLLCLLLAVPALADAPGAGDTLYVANPDPADRLNLRAAPRPDAVSLGKYYNGTPVYLLEAPSEGYAHVRIQGDSPEGYMDLSFLSAEYVEPAFPILTVAAASGAAVYRQPTASSELITLFPKGSSVCALCVRDDGWVQITAIGYTGYVRSDRMTPQLSYHRETDSSAVINNASDQSAAYTVQVSLPSLAVVSNPDPQDRLNLREAPDASAPILGKYFSGTIVSLLGPVEDGWVKVCISGAATGYMQSRFLECGGQSVRSAMPDKTVAVSDARLYAAPSKSSSVVSPLSRGAQLRVMGAWGDWCHVLYDGQTGFVLTSALDSDEGLTFVLPARK